MTDPIFQPAGNRERPGPMLGAAIVFAVLGIAGLLVLVFGYWPLR